MGTYFRGVRQSRGAHMDLHDFPEWGLDIMRGLYGPDTVAAECERGRARTRPEPPPADPPEPAITALEAELLAFDALGAFFMRLVRRR
ncbi:hypothetical protein ABLE92_08270 [Gordonia sp. VNQ95]|uniref:hypothetical protein n=1 Tax=Gordonia TaxID=2053 RepID=UPI0032B6173C